MDAQKEITKWLQGPFDEKTKEEIRQLQKENPQELEKAFGSTLKFGTGGMREIMGVGTARMNRYTIQMATQGLATAVKKAFPDEPLRAFIGYDSRHHSKEFAEETAKVLAANGFDVYLPSDLCTTPFTSFACRELKCHAAVMITASHNPPEYNGFKVYWQDGTQIVAPHDAEIVAEVKKITNITQVEQNGSGKILSSPLDLYDKYFQAITPLAFFPKQNHKKGSELKILYTSLHGSGMTLTPRGLKEWGFTNVALVEEQCIPDGNFPTTASPNPESEEGLSLGCKKLQETNSDILIANDPDADRIGIAILHDGKIHRFSGNEIAIICLHHILSSKKLPKNGAVVTTIVTTELFHIIASAFDIACFEVLTGFKYIGEKIREWEDGTHTFLFGAEESMGYLIGTHSRDKDATVMACLISEIALKCKLQNITLYDYLQSLYETYGSYREKVFLFPLTEGKMESIRENHPKQFFDKKVTHTIDYLEETPLPKSNVLQFRLEDGSKLIFRPSGTEPKIKVYLSLKNQSADELDRRGEMLCDFMK